MSKNRKLLTIIVILAVVIGIASIYILNDRNSKVLEKQSDAPQLITKKACELFGISEAKKLLGEAVKQAEPSTAIQKVPDRKDVPPPAAEVETEAEPTDSIDPTAPTNNPSGSSSSTTASPCMYVRQGQGDAAQSQISILVLPAADADAKKNFDAATVSGGNRVSGYGENAYWQTGKDFSGREYGQLVILESGGVVTIAGGLNDLELSKKIAKVIEGTLND